jgi:hypothetical protein
MRYVDMPFGDELGWIMVFSEEILPTCLFLKGHSTTKDILSVCQILWYIPSFGVWSKVNQFSSFDENSMLFLNLIVWRL